MTEGILATARSSSVRTCCIYDLIRHKKEPRIDVRALQREIDMRELMNEGSEKRKFDYTKSAFYPTLKKLDPLIQSYFATKF
jgi:hypothetical protein